MLLTRRKALFMLAAPAIIRPGLLMPILTKVIAQSEPKYWKMIAWLEKIPLHRIPQFAAIEPWLAEREAFSLVRHYYDEYKKTMGEYDKVEVSFSPENRYIVVELHKTVRTLDEFVPLPIY